MCKIVPVLQTKYNIKMILIHANKNRLVVIEIEREKQCGGRPCKRQIFPPIWSRTREQVANLGINKLKLTLISVAASAPFFRMTSTTACVANPFSQIKVIGLSPYCTGKTQTTKHYESTISNNGIKLTHASNLEHPMHLRWVE